MMGILATSKILVRLTAIFAAILSCPANAEPAPKLVVVVVVDQFAADLFDEYRGRFDKGLSRLASQGAVFPSAYHGQAATETCPGAATIMTGGYPARTGIIANSWFDLGIARANKQVYCAEDADAPGSGAQRPSVSAKNLHMDTLGDLLKRTDPKSRTISVAGKDRLALMLGGHKVDELWYWAGKAFIGLDETTSQPSPVTRANAMAQAAIDHPAESVISQRCRDHLDPQPLFQGAANLPSAPRPGDRLALRTSAIFDQLTANLALDLAEAKGLGSGPSTDILTIGLAATDYIGHATGRGSAEMCEQMFALDQIVGTIVDRLERMNRPFVLALTADHGSQDAPERSRLHGNMKAVRFDPNSLLRAVNTAVRSRLGVDAAATFAYGEGFGDIYLSPTAKQTRPQIAAVARQAIGSMPEVDAVLTADELLRTDIPKRPVTDWTLRQRARASFDAMRSGDLIVLLKPDVTPIARPLPGVVASHGGTSPADQRVPVLFWWPGIKRSENTSPVEAVDIMPTLAAIIGLKVPSDAVDGHCLSLGQKGNWPCVNEREDP